jgi:subtilase family serine protease
VEQPGDLGLRSHTNLLIYVPQGGAFQGTAQPAGLPPFAGYFFETPSSIACIYQLVSQRTPGCNPNTATENPTGGSRAIAIVDAYDDPTAVADLATFSTQFGLPPANFSVIYAQGSKPALDPTGGWEVEESLDIEWAHAMAPNAQIFLVEAADNSDANLYPAIALASQLVAGQGGGEVSMSWGESEFNKEAQLDAYFRTPGVVYVAAAGDSPGPIYPSTSPHVISAGGTTISRNSVTGRFILENTWQDAGGGASLVEPRPGFQDIVAEIVGGARGTPDLSFDANPNTGVWVWDGNAVPGAGWYIVGGTSVSAPSLAGIINAAGRFHASSQAENAEVYRHLYDQFTLRDITYGNCGLNIGDFAIFGWDFCTGVGTSLTYTGK